MSAGWLWTPEGFSPCDSAPLTDRGFRYGMSVFESFPVRKKSPLFLQQHLQRLESAAATAAFPTVLPSSEEIKKLLRDENRDGFARIYVTAGDGDVSLPAGRCRVFVFVEPRAPNAASVYERGYRLTRHPNPHAPLFGGLKTANYWANIAALQAARKQNFDEALLFSSDSLLSACMANVFVVRDGKITTPALAGGTRDGVVRAWVAQRRSAEECNICDEDLKNADEIFLTSSWLGVMPVASLDTRALPSRTTASALRGEYENETGGAFSGE